LDRQRPSGRRFFRFRNPEPAIAGRVRLRLILEGLEAALNPAEQIEDAGVSIEHVLPRTLGDGASGDSWPAALGPEWEAEHDRLVHVIGNLSLTGANSDMGNRDFETKRAILRDSRFLLNREVTRATAWNAAAIEARSQDLAARAAAIWSRPAGIPDGRGPGGGGRSRTDTKRFKSEYWAAVLPVLEQLPFVTEVPQARTFGLVGLPLTRKAFRYGLRPRFQKRRLSLLLFMRGPERERNFDKLIAERAAIEGIVGERLIWRKSVPWSKATSVVELVGEGLDPNDPATLERQKVWFLHGLERFHAAFHDRCVALAPGDEPRKMTPTRLKRQRWWTQVLEALATQSTLFAGRRPPAETWIGEGCGIRGLQFTMGAAKAHSSAELYIDRGRKGREEGHRALSRQTESDGRLATVRERVAVGVVVVTLRRAGRCSVIALPSAISARIRRNNWIAAAGIATDSSAPFSASARHLTRIGRHSNTPRGGDRSLSAQQCFDQGANHRFRVSGDYPERAQ